MDVKALGAMLEDLLDDWTWDSDNVDGAIQTLSQAILALEAVERMTAAARDRALLMTGRCAV